MTYSIISVVSWTSDNGFHGVLISSEFYVVEDFVGVGCLGDSWDSV